MGSVASFSMRDRALPPSSQVSEGSSNTIFSSASLASALMSPSPEPNLVSVSGSPSSIVDSP